MNIYQFYKKKIKKNINKIFLYDENFSIIFQEFDNYVSECAYYLNSIKKKEFTVLSLLPNSIDQLVIFTASFLAGKNFLPLDCESSDIDIDETLKIIKPEIVFISPNVNKFKKKNYSVKKILVNNNLKWLKKSDKYFKSNKIGDLLIKTSGSTGKPKIIKIKIENLFKSSLNFIKSSEIPDKKYKFWNYLPMSYLGGLFNLFIIPFTLSGSIFVSNTINGLYLLNFFNYIKKYKINTLWLIPTIIRSLNLIYKNFNKVYSDELDFAFVGTAPISLNEKINFEKKFNIKLLESYGLSETTFISCEKYSNQKRYKSTVGKIIKNVNLKINRISREITVKTPYLFEGYIHEDHFEKINKKKYFKTKDQGSMYRGLLRIVGRLGSLIKKGGKLINLVEIENRIRDYCPIKDVIAKSIKDKIYGESYNLYIVPNKNIDDLALYKSISKVIPASQMPSMIKTIKAFKKTRSGKIKLNETFFK